MFERGHNHYVFPRQCEHVFYSNVPGERDWSFVVRYDPRGRPIKYTHLQEEDDIEYQEDDLTEYQTDPKDHGGSTDEEDEEDHDLGIGDNIAIPDDDIDENILENDIDDDDDDDDIINPFNIISELDDDQYVKFDEEDQDRE